MFSSFFTRRICSLCRKKSFKLASRKLRHRLDSPEFLRGLEAFIVSDGEDAEEALAASEVVVSNRRVVFLTGRVEDVNLYFFTVQNHLKVEIDLRSMIFTTGKHANLFSIAVGFCWLVVFDKFIIHELQGELKSRRSIQIGIYGRT